MMRPMYWLLFYEVVDDFVRRRGAFRMAHLSLADSAHRQGILVLSGALADPADSVVFVFRVESTSQIEEFVHNDPYVRNGLVTSWKIRQWNVVVGQPQTPEPGQTRSGIW